MHPSKNAKVMFCHPSKSPAAARNLMSPPPMALPLLKSHNKYRTRLTAKNPITYFDICGRSEKTFIIPRTNIKILHPIGISYVLKSITDITIRTEASAHKIAALTLSPYVAYISK